MDEVHKNLGHWKQQKRHMNVLTTHFGGFHSFRGGLKRKQDLFFLLQVLFLYQKLCGEGTGTTVILREPDL